MRMDRAPTVASTSETFSGGACRAQPATARNPSNSQEIRFMGVQSEGPPVRSGSEQRKLRVSIYAYGLRPTRTRRNSADPSAMLVRAQTHDTPGPPAGGVTSSNVSASDRHCVKSCEYSTWYFKSVA